MHSMPRRLGSEAKFARLGADSERAYRPEELLAPWRRRKPTPFEQYQANWTALLRAIDEEAGRA
jgi:hypothetical protein